MVAGDQAKVNDAEAQVAQSKADFQLAAIRKERFARILCAEQFHCHNPCLYIHIWCQIAGHLRVYVCLIDVPVFGLDRICPPG